MNQTLEQKRAEFAWQCATRGQMDTKDKYGKLAKGVPVLIMSSGLMQTLATLADKGSKEHQLLTEHICKWLGNRLGGESTHKEGVRFPMAQEADYSKVMGALFVATPGLYRRAQEEAVAILRWIRQLATTV